MMDGDNRGDERGSTRAYHHGALRDALIEAAEAILAEKGVEGFTLRECARRAGVSPAAPAHHFGDVTGLLTVVATRGFEALTEALRDGNRRAGADPARRLREQGIGYVTFALRSPGAFKLIFRKDRLHCANPGLRVAASGAFQEFETAVRELRGASPGSMDAKTFSSVIAAWSLVHGFAHLAVDGEFDRFLPDGDPGALLAQVLPGVLDWLPRNESGGPTTGI